MHFSHEKLNVYQESIRFVTWLSNWLEQVPNLGEMRDQLNRATSSSPLNIAEGNGKFTFPDRCRFFDIAHGSALECAAALDVLVARLRAKVEDVGIGKESLKRIVQMLVGLLKRLGNRKYERGLEPDSD